MAGGTRYRLLETMRQFGQANLVAADVAAKYRGRHVDYYADYVLSRRPRLYGADDLAAHEEVEREFENIPRHTPPRGRRSRIGAFRRDARHDLHSLDERGRVMEGTAWSLEIRDRPVVDAPRGSWRSARP